MTLSSQRQNKKPAKISAKKSAKKPAKKPLKKFSKKPVEARRIKLIRHKNYKIYYDNWFSCPFLAQFLLDYGFHSVSTVQKRRVKGLEFPSSDKKFLKSPRGRLESMVNEK